MAAGTAIVTKAGRTRRALGWVLLALGVLVAGVWFASGWHLIDLGSADRRVWIYTGSLGTEFKTPDPSDLRIFGTWIDFGHAEPSGFDGLGWRARDSRANLFFETNQQGFDTDLLVVGLRACADGEGSIVHVWCLALWPIAVVLLTPATLLLRSGLAARRRVLRGMCRSCGYDLAGLGPEAPCPECGKQKASHG